MKELYFLNVLGRLSSLSTTVFVIAFLALIVSSVAFILVKIDYNKDDDEYIVTKKCFKTSLITAAIFFLPTILIPCRTDLYVIYGVGSAIDVLKESPAAKELPENTFKALNAFTEKYMEKVDKEKTEEDTDEDFRK